MASFGILSVFDHDLQTWQTYKSRLEQWFIANDVKETVKKRAILLSALSDGTYRLAADLALPKELPKLPYEDITKLLDDHFTPKSVGFGERFTFYSATQNVGESFTQFAARLRGLTARCQFLNVEETLRDRFLMAMLSGPEKEKLFAQDFESLTLAKAAELADSMRSARAVAAAAAAAAASTQGPAHSDQLFKIAKSATNGGVNKVQQCSVCGYKNHESSQCRFANYKCKKCNEKGHLRRMCKKINFLQEEGSLEGTDDDGELFNIRSFNGEPMMETILVQGVQMKFQIDSGSAVTAISERTYKHYFANVPLAFTGKRLLTYTGTQIECLGTIHLSVAYKDRTHKLYIYVIRNGGHR